MNTFIIVLLFMFLAAKPAVPPVKFAVPPPGYAPKLMPPPVAPPRPVSSWPTSSSKAAAAAAPAPKAAAPAPKAYVAPPEPPTVSGSKGVTCGKRPLVEGFLGFGSRIIGGVEAQQGAWPWQVSLQEPYAGSYAHGAGAVVLNQWWLLSAGHVFKQAYEGYKKYRALIGAYTQNKLGPEVAVRTLVQRIYHDKYDEEAINWDIMVLKLNASITFSDYIQPACFPTKATNVAELTDCYVSGWGMREQGSFASMPNILNEAKVNRIETATCNQAGWYRGAVKDFNICAGFEEGEVDTCQGDSGGPLSCRKPGTKTYIVIGVASWGVGCGSEHHPGVYTSTQYFIDWILQKTAV